MVRAQTRQGTMTETAFDCAWILAGSDYDCRLPRLVARSAVAWIRSGVKSMGHRSHVRARHVFSTEKARLFLDPAICPATTRASDPPSITRCGSSEGRCRIDGLNRARPGRRPCSCMPPRPCVRARDFSEQI
nr:unnamed protein product [Digitaria exilis]